MKITTLLTILLFGVPLLVMGQNIEVYYSEKPVLNPKIVEQMPAHYKQEYIASMKRKAETKIVHRLTYVNGKSLFENIILDNVPNNTTYHFFDIYKDLKKKKTIADMKGGEALVRDFDYLKWELTQDTMTILGLLCYKAHRYIKGKISSEVWYAPSMPIMDGPGMFSGLPGLILKADMQNAIYEAFDIRPLGKDAPPIVIPEFSGIIEEGAMREAIIERATKKNRR